MKHLPKKWKSLFCWLKASFENQENPDPKYDLVLSLFFKFLGFGYLCAFLSLGVQILGLIGENGILPVQNLTETFGGHFGWGAFWQLPMIFWIEDADWILQGSCWIGIGLSVLLFLGIKRKISLISIFILYLSLVNAGQVFMDYQWDMFLLEVGVLSILLTFDTRFMVWVVRWFLFRFFMSAGLIKVLGDVSWENLSALQHHFLTQPLPHTISSYVYNMPEFMLKFGVQMTFLIQIILPFLIFFPKRFRAVTAVGFILLELTIFWTGNYTFFNVLTIGLCFFLFDDDDLKKIISPKIIAFLKRGVKPTPKKIKPVIKVIALSLVTLSTWYTVKQFWKIPTPFVIQKIESFVSPFRVVNRYGPFVFIRKTRQEIIIEGSKDGKTWEEYEFWYKPGDISRAPVWNAPHQPRLDWQMWFASQETLEKNPWFINFVYSLLQNSPDVLKLIERNPFREGPPQYIRAKLYEYHFTTPQERSETENWWRREFLKMYMAPVKLNKNAK